MKVVEMLCLGRKLLETMQTLCIKTSDVRYLPMYSDYVKLRASNEKMSYISALLSEKYGISERQFFYVIKRFEQDCKMLAE